MGQINFINLVLINWAHVGVILESLKAAYMEESDNRVRIRVDFVRFSCVQISFVKVTNHHLFTHYKLWYITAPAGSYHLG